MYSLVFIAFIGKNTKKFFRSNILKHLNQKLLNLGFFYMIYE
ncbi:hypothetical protein SYNTR_0416 [Candidatus Syntrophocurvum alkaliphilum]|uniref:Uncharacterized protein n=1 Tax=Candidatus Syntrophocurvum alkaliphilum TaxID=2293317 RepID=A0A6I6DHA3_9FIRM|nr:hypothetical protein SYNTR_0416 [Candidatus Syntrophocurvum alkaliphilum]